ncbi:MAG TPA: hypothetical protein VGL44_10455 [Gaiellales bacterium]
MHVRAVLKALLAAGVATAIAGCGSSAKGPPAFGSDTLPVAKTLTGVVVIQSDSQTGKPGAREPDVTVGLYLAPIHAGGPIAADPPQPVMQVKTDRQGAFRFAGLKPGKRYYVFASGAKGYTIGRWAKAGEDVRLTVCTTCVMPL